MMPTAIALPACIWLPTSRPLGSATTVLREAS